MIPTFRRDPALLQNRKMKGDSIPETSGTSLLHADQTTTAVETHNQNQGLILSTDRSTHKPMGRLLLDSSLYKASVDRNGYLSW